MNKEQFFRSDYETFIKKYRLFCKSCVFEFNKFDTTKYIV